MTPLSGPDRPRSKGRRLVPSLAAALFLPLLLLVPARHACAFPSSGGGQPSPQAEGERFLAAGRLPEAKGAFERALAADPSNLSAHKGLAIVLERTGDVDGARIHYEKALPGEPKDGTGVRVNLASIYNLKGNPAKAVELLEPVLPEDGKDATGQLVLGMAYLGKGEKEKALRRFRAVQRLEPGSERGFLAAAVGYRVSGKPREAKAELEKALKSHPDSSAVPYQLGEVLASLGDLPGAVERFREAERKGGDAVLLKKRIADLRMEGKKYKEAIPLYRELLSSKVGEEAYGNLAAAQRLSGDGKGALATLAAMEKAYPKSAAAPHRAGLLLGISGRIDEAVAAFRRAHAKAPSDPVIRRDLAVALCRKGVELSERKLEREAVKSVKEALALSPDFPGRDEAARFVKDSEKGGSAR
jgi:tetratricopeptide (TPR) repeat protein